MKNTDDNKCKKELAALLSQEDSSGIPSLKEITKEKQEQLKPALSKITKKTSAAHKKRLAETFKTVTKEMDKTRQ